MSERTPNLADSMMGCHVVDKVTGFEGIITAKVEYLYGCTQYGVSPKAVEGKVQDTQFFDEGRLTVLDKGIRPEEVQGKRPGGSQRDMPRGLK